MNTNNMNSKKNILLVVPMLHQGGFERICVITAEILKKQSDKYNVYLAVFTRKDQFYDVDVKIIDLDLGAANGKLGKLMNVFKRAGKLSRIIKEYNIDVVYSFGETANIASSLTKANGVKKITALHSFGEINDTFYMKLLEKKGGQVISCAKAIASDVKSRYSIPDIKVVWNPCDITSIKEKSNEEILEHKDFFEKKNEDDFIIVTMGREDDVKGYWHLIKVFKLVQQMYPHSKLAIFGDGSFTEYKELTNKLGLEDNVLFGGMQKNPFSYLKRSDVFVLSSISEGLPNVLVEAMAVGLPIVSVNCKSGPAEILHSDWEKVETDKGIFDADYGILTAPLSPEKNLQVDFIDEKIVLDDSERDLASGIIKMLNKDELNRYSQKGLKRCNDFSIAAYSSKIEELFE